MIRVTEHGVLEKIPQIMVPANQPHLSSSSQLETASADHYIDVLIDIKSLMLS